MTLPPDDPRIAGNLGYLGHAAALAAPDSLAFIQPEGPGPRDTSHRMLEQRQDRMAALLAGLGLDPGTRVALAMGNRVAFVEAFFGAMRAGLVPVPLNIRAGAGTLAHILADAGCRAALVEPGCHPALVAVAEAADLTHRLALAPVPSGWTDLEVALADTPPAFRPPRLPDGHPAFQPYTSGSTGRPKGVVLTHAGQLWSVRTEQRYWPVSAADRALCAVPLYHKNAMAGAIKPMLQVGGSVVLLPGFEPRGFLTALAQWRCTYAGAVPAVFARLLDHPDLIRRLDFSALTALSIGSAPVQESLLEAIEQAFGCPVGESYGLTEGGPVMIGPPVDGRPVPRGSCGVAWPEGEVKLIGPDGREDASDGELWVRNPGVTPGYHNLPDVTAERLKDGWLATGDLFHRDAEGFFYFRGRADDRFNTGGENLYPKEVETLLMAHPGVTDAAVMPLPHPVKGQVPVAMVAIRPDAGPLDEAALKAWCLDRGPAFAHPRRVLVVAALPLGGAGKVDRTAVAAALEAAFAAELMARDS